MTGRDASLFLEPGGLGLLHPGIDAEAVVPKVLATSDDRLVRAYEVVMALRTADSSHRDLEDVLATPPGSVAPAEGAGEIARARRHLDDRFGAAGQVLLESGRRLWRWSGHNGLPAADDIADLVLQTVPQEDAPDRLLVVEALRQGLARADQADGAPLQFAPSEPHEVDAGREAGPAQGPEGTNDYGMGYTPASDPATAATVDAEISETVRLPSTGSEEAEPAAIVIEPVRLAPDGEARRSTLEALRQMPVPELKARGIVTAIALDRKVAEIRAGGMTWRRIQAKRALQDGLIAVRDILTSRGERLPDHRPTKEAAVVRCDREVQR